ncbi:asparagine synthase (glutamine-hydrolyzing) [Longirhabdus pacifica]|uniref:asparagine synthase (glutamine-hydrolyzing) n=1 Tax=Longirhabdus pacifica TaxID=2305227 RepID=UPI001008A341|nr:asparagine synthase (glutamine-hydrolyzing) [Longirhabdus pacifica]
MCGITGVVRFDQQKISPQLLTPMMNVIQHRGPDDAGVWTDQGVGLGFRRLSIIDLAEGHQPLCNEDESVWIVFNGEIYNYKELRHDLMQKGHQFKTESDTETIVHLYEQYGSDCVKYLRGMFGFAIWDKRKKQLFAARDHFGIKPFYYTYNQKQFVFGSEIKSLLQMEGVKNNINQESLYNYLTFQYVPEPLTMFQGIHKLRPGHTLTVTYDGKVQIAQYWDPMFEPEEKPFDYYVEQIRETLKESVKLHIQSDVDRGCFLSSGIDSTATSTLMRQIEEMKTFSVGFEGAQNETIIAKQTAEAIGTDHYAKLISQQDFFNVLPHAVWHQDEPVADPSAIALYHVAQLAKEHVTVVLSGEGADELFGGYRIYREPLALRPLSWLPLPMRRMLGSLAGMLPAGVKGRNYLLRASKTLEERFLGNAQIFSDDMKAQLLTQPVSGDWKVPHDFAKQFYDKTKHLDDVSRMQYIDLNLWMPGDILMKADKMTMAHSLELRVPFLDKELFEVARKIPMKYRIAQGTTKYVFRKAMEGIIPDFILNRPKLGFPVPLREWVKGNQGKVMLEQMQASGMEDYINMSEVEMMLRNHQQGNGDYARKLWTIYMFGLWHQTYMGQQFEAKAAGI